MGEDSVPEAVSDPSHAKSGSDSKVLGEKRSGSSFGEQSETPRKRVKMRDLESVLRSEGIDTHCPKSLKNKEAADTGENEISQVMEEPMTMNLSVTQVERVAKQVLLQRVDLASESLDLNSEVCAASKSTHIDHLSTSVNTNRSSSHKHKMDGEAGVVATKGTGLDLNAKDASSLVIHNPFYPYKNLDNLKPVDASECGSTTGPLDPEKKDPLRVWNEMKQNGFLSSSHGGIPVPRQRGRKSKNDNFKKKMELARKEQVDKFAKIAAPSGLLNDLNPGIINHVRNSKQVHSIIEALVKSEKLHNACTASKQENRLQGRTSDFSERNKDSGKANEWGSSSLFHSNDAGAEKFLTGNKQPQGCPLSLKRPHHLSSFDKDGHSCSLERRDHDRSLCTSENNHEMDDDMLALKLSSTTKDTLLDTTSYLCNKDPSNISGIPALSVKAATVSSQWMELLHQDLKGRLAALRRSKKRVRDVIRTELPFLMSKEFSSNRENDPYVLLNSAVDCSDKSIADMHYERWSVMFDRMDKALSEEEKLLESWLNEVKEMQMHCGWGLQHFPSNAPRTLQELRAFDKDFRSVTADNSERELAVRAAAASIYSTCNFLMSKENVSCC